MNDELKLKNNLKEARAEKKLSQTQLTEMIGVRSPCGPVSTRSTFLLCIANPMPRFTAVVVFPTPPFWLHIAMVLQFGISLFLLLMRFGPLDPPKHRKRSPVLWWSHLTRSHPPNA